MKEKAVEQEVRLNEKQWERASEYFQAYTGVSVADIPPKFSPYVLPAKEIVKNEGRLQMKHMTAEVTGHPRDGLQLDDGIAFSGKQIGKAYEEAQQIVLFAAAMVNIQEILQRHSEMMEAFFIEYWTVSLLSICREQLQSQLAEQYRNSGLQLTGVWSPGQSGFELQNQIPLFDLLKPQTIGITLDEHQRMLPLKSISGTAGLVPEHCEITMQPCDYCTFGKTCPGYSGVKYKDSAGRRLL